MHIPGCFSALAMPTDLLPRLDAPYWRALSTANASSERGAPASAARAAGVFTRAPDYVLLYLRMLLYLTSSFTLLASYLLMTHDE